MARTKVRTSQLSADHWSVEYLLPVVQLPITIQCWDIVFCLAKAHPACQWFDPPATWRWSDPDSWPFSPGNQASGIDPFNSMAMFHGELFDFEGTCHFPSYHFISTISYYIKNYIPGSLYLILYIYNPNGCWFNPPFLPSKIIPIHSISSSIQFRAAGGQLHEFHEGHLLIQIPLITKWYRLYLVISCHYLGIVCFYDFCDCIFLWFWEWLCAQAPWPTATLTFVGSKSTFTGSKKSYTHTHIYIYLFIPIDIRTSESTYMYFRISRHIYTHNMYTNIYIYMNIKYITHTLPLWHSQTWKYSPYCNVTCRSPELLIHVSPTDPRP